MVEVNLLPWRTIKKNYEKKVANKLLLISLLASFVSVILIHAGFLMKIHNASAHVGQLKGQINDVSIVQMPIKNEDESTLQVSVITKNLLLALAENPQSNVCFREIKRKQSMVIFQGNSRSAADLTNFLRDWSVTNLFSEIIIDYLKFEPRDQLMRFRFHAIENE